MDWALANLFHSVLPINQAFFGIPVSLDVVFNEMEIARSLNPDSFDLNTVVIPTRQLIPGTNLVA
jgi:hypothetical protein